MESSDAERPLADDAAAAAGGSVADLAGEEESMEEQDDLEGYDSEMEVVADEQAPTQVQPLQPPQARRPLVSGQSSILNFVVKGARNVTFSLTGGAARVSSGSSGGARGGDVTLTVSQSGGGQQRASGSAAASSTKRGSSSSAGESIDQPHVILHNGRRRFI